MYDFVGMRFTTRAFGQIVISRQEGDYLFFEVDGSEKRFALPECIVQGFLIPEDPAIVESYKARQELQVKLKALQKEAEHAVYNDKADFAPWIFS